MSRQDEIRCLDRVRSAYSNAFGIKIDFDNTDNSFYSLLASCRSNPAENVFPDFICEGGAMEHFLIGSTKEGRKGSEFMRLERRESERQSAFIDDEKRTFVLSSLNCGTVRTASITTRFEGFSYGDFLKSLERNWSNHVGSLKKSNRKYGVVAFLMEQQTPRMCVFKNGRFSHFYVISQDKNALSILAKHSDDVRYAVYFVADSIEVIDLTKLPLVMANARENEDIRGGRLIKDNPLFCIDI